MTLHEEWISKAYDNEGRALKNFWDVYIPKEKKIYEHMISKQITNISGTIKELAGRFDITELYVCGFIDGINDILPEPCNMSLLETDTTVSIEINFEMLYKRMVECKAEHLYSMPEWDNIFTEEQRKELFWEQKKSGTVVRDSSKVGRNDPCPCGSGNKYKKCCGR